MDFQQETDPAERSSTILPLLEAQIQVRYYLSAMCVNGLPNQILRNRLCKVPRL